VILAPGLRTQFRLIDGVYVFDAAIGSVAVAGGLSTPSAASPTIARQAPPLRDNFSIFAPIKLKGVVVRITTPDGRTVERRQRG
jgi:hypothetical protein